MKQYDIAVYGASGLAARYIIIKLLKNKDIKIAAAGRCKKRIESNLEGIDIKFPIKEVALQDIDMLTSETKILINCAGPYIYSGEVIVESCLRNNTHYLDISGETFFIERCINKFNDEAKRKNLCIVNCCGFDSVPADMATEHLRKHIAEECGDKKIKIESILTLKNCVINKTTFDSAVHGFGKIKQTKALRKKSVSNKTKREPVKKLFYDKDQRAYCTIFPGTDASIVKRSQKDNNCDYFAYVKIGGFFKMIIVAYFGLIFYLLAMSRLGRSLLLKFPNVFTMNFIKNRRPEEQEIEKGRFEFLFRGYCEDRFFKMLVTGPDPGYKTTAICITECAFLLLKMEGVKGGVLTPAQIFDSEKLVKGLQKNGMFFIIFEGKKVTAEEYKKYQ